VRKKVVHFIVLVLVFFLFALARLLDFRISISFKGEQEKDIKLSEVVRFVKSIKVKGDVKEFMDYDIHKMIAYIDSFFYHMQSHAGENMGIG
jgi:hypothetical protein